MIYLGTHQYTTDIYVHDFYFDNYFYSVYKNGLKYEYKRMESGYFNAYVYVKPFSYVLPETLNYIKYSGIFERIDVLNNIVEQKIFENI